MASMEPIERLLAIEEIRRVKARYFRVMDAKDWDGFAEVFCDDATMDMTPIGGPITHGNLAIAEFVRGVIGDVLTVHHGHMPEIDVRTATTADGIWAMEDLLRWPAAGGRSQTLHGWGHYHETYEKRNGEWRVKTLTLTRLRNDVGTEAS
jgi:ketosteroid isomerase-like protein